MAPEGFEAEIADNMFGAKVLKLGAVSASIFGEGHQGLSSHEIAVVIGCDVGNEIRWLIGSDSSAADGEVTHGMTLAGVRKSVRVVTPVEQFP